MTNPVSGSGDYKNPDMANKARNEIVNGQNIRKDYTNWYKGKDTSGNYEFKMNDENGSFYAKSNENGSIYEVSVSPSEGLLRAKVNNDDGSIMTIQGNRDRNNSYHSTLMYDIDFENDGETDYRFGTYYDKNGALTRVVEDRDNDGQMDCECTYLYDEETGRLTNTSLTSMVNGNMVSESNVKYFGNVKPHYGCDCEEKFTYWNKDGIPETTTKVFDTNGKVVEMRGEGYIRKFAYDEQGRLKIECYEDTTDNDWFSKLIGASNDYTKLYSYDEMVIKIYDNKGRLYKTEPIEQ